MWAIIGGSGFEKSERVTKVAELDRKTPFGEASSGLKKVQVAGVEALFLPRHGLQHERLPSEVNFRANIYALKRHGARRVLCTSAIGSLQRELKPGDLVVPRQYIDRTKSVRQTSFCGDGLVGHVSLAQPVCPACVQLLEQLTGNLDFPVHFGKTYVCIEGPYFSTQAESNSYRVMGAEIIGMTAFPEYALAREAGLCYLPCCFVTDYDCWDDSIPHVTLQEILDVMQRNNERAFGMIEQLLQSELSTDCDCAEGGLRTGLMTPAELIPEKHRAWLELLQS